MNFNRTNIILDLVIIFIILYLSKYIYQKIKLKNIIYFDNASTTNIYPECLDMIVDVYQKNWFNPSSVYHQGVEAQDKLQQYKKDIAQHINATPEQVFFVSGSTEANNLILRGLMEKNDTIIISKMEHPSIYETALDISPNNTLYVKNSCTTGLIDLKHLEELLQSNPQTKIVSIIGLSNITGSIQDIKSISKMCKRFDVWFHCDTTQWIGKFDFNVKELGIDSCCASAHKFHGCKQVGFLYVKNPTDKNLHNVVTGGKQQSIRSGTEALPQVSCMVCAMSRSLQEYSDKQDQIISIRNYIINNISKKIPNTKLIGFDSEQSSGSSNAPHIVNILLPFSTLDMVKQLGNKNICLSIGSACSKGKPSQALLKAFKIPIKQQLGSLRISLSHMNTMREAKILVNSIVRYYKQDKQDKDQK